MVAKCATYAGGAMLLPSLVQVSESISGSVVPLAMFDKVEETHHDHDTGEVCSNQWSFTAGRLHVAHLKFVSAYYL